MTWAEMQTGEKLAAVRRLVDESKSFLDIARALRASSRNTVSAFCKYHGIRTKNTFGGRHENRARGPRESPAKLSLEAAFQPLTTSVPCHLIEAGESRCKWPVDGLEGRAGTVCGARIEFMAVYCDEHKAMAFQTRRKAA